MNAQDTGFMSKLKNKFAASGLIPGGGQPTANPAMPQGAAGAGGMDMNKMMQMMLMQEAMRSPGKNAGPEEWLAKLPMLLGSGMLADKPKTIDPNSGKPSEMPKQLPPGMQDPSLEPDPSFALMGGMPMGGASLPDDMVKQQMMRQLMDAQMIPNNFGY